MSTAVKTTSKVTQLSQYMGALKGQMSLALPKHLTADRMTRLVLTEFSKTPALQDCTFESIAGCVMTAAQLGLEIGVGGQAYIIPYKGKATFVPGWKGLIDLVNRAGRATAWTGAVFEGDVFDWACGDSPYVRHKPMGEDEPSKLLFSYAIGRVTGSEWPIIECWPNERLKKHFKRHNKVGDKHYAHQNWEMYCRKIVLLQVMKYLPQAIELRNAIELTHAAESGQGGSIVDGESISFADDATVTEPSTPKTVNDLRPAVMPPATKQPTSKPHSPAFDVKDMQAKLAACQSPDDITALFKTLDLSALSPEDRDFVNDLGMTREREIIAGK